jgi:hypothetical protein
LITYENLMQKFIFVFQIGIDELLQLKYNFITMHIDVDKS